jgi:hypothetical protein
MPIMRARVSWLVVMPRPSRDEAMDASASTHFMKVRRLMEIRRRWASPAGVMTTLRTALAQAERDVGERTAL